MGLKTRKQTKLWQHIVSVVLVLLVSGACYISSGLIGYKMVALILLMTVSIVAMLFDILPVLVAAILSALIWNYFFIPPIFTLHINNAEDWLMFLLYFSIVLISAVSTFKIREAEKKARDKEEKENTIKLYNTLLNSLSHELRTPISAIIGAVDTLKENKSKLSEKLQNELLTEIDKASMRLNRQVENLLNMSRLETGMLKPKLDWCDLNELIHFIIQKNLMDGFTQTITFKPNENLPFFKLDSGLIEQALQNLLHNAIQYTPKYAIIKIEAKYEQESCIVSIIDNGPGFPESEIKLVFDKFYRLPNSKTGGSGLGLSIVKGFVEALGGQITLQNNITGGAMFTIVIPCETSFINNLKNE